MKKACTFVGDKSIEEFMSIDESLYEAMRDAIENKGVEIFYIAHGTMFERKYFEKIHSIKRDYPNVLIILIRNRMTMTIRPRNEKRYDGIIFTNRNTYCDGYNEIEHHKRWVIDNSDVVISYSCFGKFTGAVHTYVEESGKEIIKLKKKHI